MKVWCGGAVGACAGKDKKKRREKKMEGRKEKVMDPGGCW